MSTSNRTRTETKATELVSPPWWAWQLDLTTLAEGAGYMDGNDAGDVGAIALLKYCRASRERPTGGNLQHIVLDLCDAIGKVPVDSAEYDFLKGQIVGMFASLDGWVRAAANAFGSELDATTEEELRSQLAEATNGLTTLAWEARGKKIASDQARHAANARCGKQRAAKAIEQARSAE